MDFSPYKCARDRISPPENVYMSHIEMTKHSGILSSILSPFYYKLTNDSRGRKERKEDMSMGMMHEGCKVNEKMKLKRKIKTKNATKHKVDKKC